MIGGQLPRQESWSWPAARARSFSARWSPQVLEAGSRLTDSCWAVVRP